MNSKVFSVRGFCSLMPVEEMLPIGEKDGKKPVHESASSEKRDKGMASFFWGEQGDCM